MQIIRVYCLSMINAVGHGNLGIVYNNGRKSAGSTQYIAVTSIFFSSCLLHYLTMYTHPCMFPAVTFVCSLYHFLFSPVSVFNSCHVYFII